MDFNADFFSLFDLPVAFALDGAQLDARFREAAAQVHPDRYAAAPEGERRLAMQWSTRVNEAYQALKKPLSRAQYLLKLAGQEVGAENNTAMPVDFLMEQMEWREQVHEARLAGQSDALEALLDKLQDRLDGDYRSLGELLDQRRDYAAAAALVRKLMFLEKLQSDIDEALVALEDQ